MSKRTRPAPRRRTASGRARKSRGGGRNSGALVRADTANPSRLVDRILSAPNLVRVVPRLPPEVLHRVVQHHGLEECGELLVLATPDQLAHVFDRDLWHAAGAASFDQFDAERFGVWIEVLVQADAVAAAAIVAGMDLDLMTTALAQHIRVFDHSAVVWYPTLDGEQASSTPFLDLDERFDVGGYVILPKREGPQDAIAALLTALDEGHRDYFSRLMSGCVRLSHSAPEIDGLDNLMSAGSQAMFAAADAREQRLGAQGYVATAQARVFLEMARRVDLRSGTACPPNAIAVEYLRDLVDPDLHAMRSAEHAFLANAILAGSSVQSRPFSSAEASEAAAAACALGRQNWPARWSGAERDRIVEEHALAQSNGVFVSQDLVCVFQVGWTILHEQVSMHAAECLIGALATLHGDDVVQSSIDALRIALTKHWRSGTPWRAKEELEVIAIFDMVSWTALLGLLAEFPVLPAAVGASLESGTREVSASAFEFISSNSQIGIVHRFLESLGDRLRA
jgi:Family of unknown function (DUF6178)